MDLGDGYTVMVDAATKFFHSLRVFGWFHHPYDKLRTVSLLDDALVHAITDVGVPHGGVASLGPNLGFTIEALRSDADSIDESVSINLATESGRSFRINLHDLCKDRMARYATPQLLHRFIDEVNARALSVLDIGGRARSRTDRRKDFTTSSYTVVDIVPGETVDVVGDAHRLSSLFPAESFDAVFSVSVFEHLMMPWAVAIEINRVLKPGGIGYVHTHQTLGMHDAPWDFWRFSDTSWDALFNRHTGFEIVDRAMDFEQFVLPFIYRPSKRDAERSAGFEGSSVMFRKVDACALQWPLSPSDITQTAYPTTDDNSQPDNWLPYHL